MRPPPRLSLDTALFLDLDGTLARIEARPDDVVFDPDRSSLVTGLERVLGGALAVLSGRSLADVDRILGGAPRSVAAVHGLVRRRADGEIIAAPPSPDLARARQVLEALAQAWSGLILEDKGLSLALHYRLAPQACEAVDAAVRGIVSETMLTRQDGIMVSELRTPGPDKGQALRAFMLDAPFAGRHPVMVGDDLTDEAAFAAASANGGFGVLVGPVRETAARYQLEDVQAVQTWLTTSLTAAAA